MKINILILSLLFFSLNCKSQVVSNGNVITPIKTYRSLRDSVFSIISECDIIKSDSDKLKDDCDSTISLMDLKLKIKDSIILGLISKCELKDSIISEKNNTIKTITSIVQPSKFRIKSEFWIGCIVGTIGMALILK